MQLLPHLLFFATAVLLIAYSILRALPVGDVPSSAILTLSWALAVHAVLYALVILTSCKTDTPAIRSVYVLCATALVVNAVLDTMDKSKGNKVPMIVGVAAVGTALLVLGLFRTELYRQCVRYKGLIKASYVASRDAGMHREQKVDVAEQVIRDMRLAPTKIHRMLRM
jgi:hypothetical protein